MYELKKNHANDNIKNKVSLTIAGFCTEKCEIFCGLVLLALLRIICTTGENRCLQLVLNFCTYRKNYIYYDKYKKKKKKIERFASKKSIYMRLHVRDMGR